MTTRIQTSLERHVMSAPTQDDHLEAMRAAAWHKRGIVTLQPEDIEDPWVRQAVINEAARRWGRRQEQ